MENYGEIQNACGCRPARNSALSNFRDVSSSSHSPPANEIPESKYFQEIGAEMIGNQLIIRVEKDKNKSSKKKAGQFDPPCDCEIPEIRMPSATKGPRIVNAGDNNQILFRIRSRNLVGKEESNYKPEAFAYQLGGSKKGKDSSDQHRAITIHPQLGDPATSQEVQSDHITDGNQNIYLLRIKKKPESPSHKKRNIELELRTPKPPPRPLSPPPRPSSQISSRRSTSPRVSSFDLKPPIETIKPAKKPVKKKASKKKKKK